MNKVILITGSNKGLGYGIAKALLTTALEFSTIILTARSTERGLAAKASLGHEDWTVFHKLDVTVQSDIENVAAFVSERFGQIDVLINNAGWAMQGDDFNGDIVRKSIETNFYGLKNMTEAFIPLIKPGGHIIQMSSNCGQTEHLANPVLAAKFLDPDLTMEQLLGLAEEFIRYVDEGTWEQHGWPTFGYGVSKNLVNSYTRMMHRDFVKHGTQLRINAVHPGWVKTDMGGENAELTIEEGIVLPVKVARDCSQISGKFWRDGTSMEFF